MSMTVAEITSTMLPPIEELAYRFPAPQMFVCDGTKGRPRCDCTASHSPLHAQHHPHSASRMAVPVAVAASISLGGVIVR